MGKVADLSVFTPGGQPGAPNPSEGLAVLRQNQTAFMETIGVMPQEYLTIADGAISPTTAVCIVDTEGGAPADDLTIINATLSDGTTLHDGMIILLSAKDQARVVTVKNSDAPNGVKTVDGKDIALSPEWSLVLKYIGRVWQQINVAAPLKPATETTLGGVKIGDGLSMGEDGTLSLPAGFIIAFAASSTTPSGYLLCNGAAVSRTTYADLFSVIGTAYGAGDGSTTFNLPDLNGRVIQGTNGDPLYVAAGLPEIYGYFSQDRNTNSGVGVTWGGTYAFSNVWRPSSDKSIARYNSDGDYNDGEWLMIFSAKGYNSIYGGSTTVQPLALTTRFYIKY